MKHFLFIFSFIIFNQSANAQDGERFERVEAILVAHITKSLDLSSAEAEKFWPVFNEFSKTEFELRASQRKIMRVLNTKFDTLTDKEITDYNVRLDKIREEIYKNENDLYKDLKGIVSDKKVLKLKFARENFQRHLLKQLRDKKKK